MLPQKWIFSSQTSGYYVVYFGKNKHEQGIHYFLFAQPMNVIIIVYEYCNEYMNTGYCSFISVILTRDDIQPVPRVLFLLRSITRHLERGQGCIYKEHSKHSSSNLCAILDKSVVIFLPYTQSK